MKRRKIALLLALTLTLTQGMGVAEPVVAEELLTDDGLEQENVLDDSEAALDVLDDEEMAEQENVVAASETEAPESADAAANMELPEVQDENSVTVEGVEVLDDDGDEDDGAQWHYDFGYDCEGTTGSQSILPKSQVRIKTQLGWTDNENWQAVEAYTLELDKNSDSMADYKADGTDIIVNTHDKTGDFAFSVNVLVDGKKVTEETFYFIVSSYVLMPEEWIDEDGNAVHVEEGESINLIDALHPYLVQYENETPIRVPDKDYRIVIDSWEDEGERWYDYDEAGWSLEEASEDGQLTLKRIGSDPTWFALTAEIKGEDDEWQPVAKREYYMDDENGDDGDDGDHKYDGHIWEDDSPYVMSVHYDGTVGNGDMLPGSEMTIRTELCTKQDLAPVTDYKLDILEKPDYGTVAVADDGKGILIRSEEGMPREDQNLIFVGTVWLPDENGIYQEAFIKEFFFSVTNTMLTPQELKMNPAIGEVIDISKLGLKMRRYENGSWTELSGDNFKIWVDSGRNDENSPLEYDYDPRAWTLQELPGGTQTLTRTSGVSTWIGLSGMEKDADGNWQSLTRKEYDIGATTEVHSHTWQTVSVEKEATCTAGGSRTEKCASCAAVRAESIPATGSHTWDAGVVTKAATCTETGIRTYTCSTCKATRTETIPVAGHKAVTDAAVAATVLTEGKTEGSHCSVCGTILKSQSTVARLTPTISLTASSLKMKTSQSTTAFRASGFAVGDSVVRVISSNEKVVKVTDVKSDGTFKLTAGKKAGTATVTVYLASTGEKSFKVTVQKTAVRTTKITTTAKELTMVKGSTYKQLASTVTVAPVTSKEKVTYASSNKKVAAVNAKGVITAKKVGTAKITIRSGKKKTVVTVKVTGVKTTNLTGVPETKTVSKGKTFRIKAKAVPKNTDEKITYTSSNKKVVTVTSKGVVKGIRKGTATITVRSGSVVKTCKVTVK